LRCESSDASFAAYRKLVYETPGFERYFWQSTVIGEIANLHIGSRPARYGGRGLAVRTASLGRAASLRTGTG
jgi:phosphoenolpyruvate carboxylase